MSNKLENGYKIKKNNKEKKYIEISITLITLKN